MKRLAVFLAFAALALPDAGFGHARRPLPRAWVRQALCVHRHEGHWHDRGAPYYGGMQMDIGFQRNYGMWAYRHFGTADRWPVWVQLRVAHRGWRDRGWSPWRNTASACGLR